MVVSSSSCDSRAWPTSFFKQRLVDLTICSKLPPHHDICWTHGCCHVCRHKGWCTGVQRRHTILWVRQTRHKYLGGAYDCRFYIEGWCDNSYRCAPSEGSWSISRLSSVSVCKHWRLSPLHKLQKNVLVGNNNTSVFHQSLAHQRVE